MAEEIKPLGPWVLIRPDPLPTMRGSLHLPGNSVEERIGHSTGTVLAAGGGVLSTTKQFRMSGSKYQDHGVRTGDKVVFRTYLQNAHRPSQLDRDRCLLHIGDILGVLEDESKTTQTTETSFDACSSEIEVRKKED